MFDQAGQDHPVVAVEGLGTARSGSRVVVSPGALDLGAMPLGGRVVQRQGEPLADGDLLDRQLEETQADGLDLEPEGSEEVIIGAIAGGDPCGAKPTGDGASPLGEDDANNQAMEPPGVSTVEMLGKSADPSGKQSREYDVSHPSSSRVIVS